MKNKKIYLILIMFIFMGFMGCSSKSANSSKTTLAKEIAETSKADEKRIDEFINTLKSNGFQIGEKKLISSEMIGAKEGYKLIVNGSSIEVYKCDLTSNDETTVKNLEDVFQTGLIYIDGSPSKAKLNKHIMLMRYEQHPEKDKIEKTFIGLK